jgi:hypothetical protein
MNSVSNTTPVPPDFDRYWDTPRNERGKHGREDDEPDVDLIDTPDKAYGE